MPKRSIGHESWEYVPTDNYGYADFKGEPCPSQKVLDKIGETGVKKIDDYIKYIRNALLMLHGEDGGFKNNNMFKMADTQTFKNDSGELIKCYINSDKVSNRSLIAKPEKVSEKNYVVYMAEEDMNIIDGKFRGEIELKYSPQREDVDSTFTRYDGKPCPTKKVVEIIGQKGVEKIHESLKKIVEQKKIIFGKNSEKAFLGDDEVFYYGNIQLVCSANAYSLSGNKSVFANPEDLIKENYIIHTWDEVDELSMPEERRKEILTENASSKNT